MARIGPLCTLRLRILFEEPVLGFNVRSHPTALLALNMTLKGPQYTYNSPLWYALLGGTLTQLQC